ncbi:MAG: outer membrane beta-barrel protein [Gammaproteobacteria bacterium]|nr:outer membrane beta-barrel protein [Gammaproteobacteria bacterium]
MRYVSGVLVFLCLAGGAEAQYLSGGPYLGASVGSFSYREDGENLGVGVSDSTTAYRLLAGYQFRGVYAVEGSWGRTGTFKERFEFFDPSGTVSFEVGGEYEIATLRFVALAPFSNVNMFGGIGYFDATLDAYQRFQTPDEVQTAMGEDADDGLTAVGGIQFDLRRLSIRGEYEWFDTDDGVDTQSLNVALLFRF